MYKITRHFPLFLTCTVYISHYILFLFYFAHLTWQQTSVSLRWPVTRKKKKKKKGLHKTIRNVNVFKFKMIKSEWNYSSNIYTCNDEFKLVICNLVGQWFPFRNNELHVERVKDTNMVLPGNNTNMVPLSEKLSIFRIFFFNYSNNE